MARIQFIKTLKALTMTLNGPYVRQYATVRFLQKTSMIKVSKRLKSGAPASVVLLKHHSDIIFCFIAFGRGSPRSIRSLVRTMAMWKKIYSTSPSQVQACLGRFKAKWLLNNYPTELMLATS
jgi:hypothetical protein